MSEAQTVATSVKAGRKGEKNGRSRSKEVKNQGEGVVVSSQWPSTLYTRRAREERGASRDYQVFSWTSEIETGRHDPSASITSELDIADACGFTAAVGWLPLATLHTLAQAVWGIAIVRY